MRILLPIALLAGAAPVAAQDIAVNPVFGTQFRYEQFTADRLLSTSDALLFRARPGLVVATGPWSLLAESDAALTVRRNEQAASTEMGSAMAKTPEAIQVNQFRLQYRGLPATIVAVGRQQLGLDAALTGDRDGEQTFDAARIQWNGLANVSADLAYAWSSRSLWSGHEGLLPETVAGDNIFAKLNWTNALGTISGYAYQIDQRHAATSDFRFVNQVYGARFTGRRRIGEDVNLSYTLGYTRQNGSLTTAISGAPTYWQIGSAFDLGDLASTQTNYRRFAAAGINLRNGEEISLATSATRGKLTLGARFTDFRAVDTDLPLRDLRVSMGLLF